MRAIDRHNVHARQHLVERFPIGRLKLVLDGRVNPAAVVIVNGQSERLGAARDRLTDAPHADNAEALAGDAAAQHPGWRPAGPIVGGDRVGALDDAPRDGKDQRHRHVGCIIGQHAGRVGDGESALQGRRNVNIVNAVAEIGDQFHLVARLLDQRRVDAVGNSRHEDVGDAQRLRQFGPRHGLVGFVQAGVEQFAHPRLDHIGELAGHDDQRLLAQHRPVSLRPVSLFELELRPARKPPRSLGLNPGADTVRIERAAAPEAQTLPQ